MQAQAQSTAFEAVPAESPKPHRFKFYGREHHDTVVGERVIVRMPLAQPPDLGPLNSLPVEGFMKFLLKHFETQFLDIMRKRGSDCSDFGLTISKDGRIGVIYTRPMDRVEVAQIRAWRGQVPTREGQSHMRPPHSDRNLPDPTVAALPAPAH